MLLFMVQLGPNSKKTILVGSPGISPNVLRSMPHKESMSYQYNLEKIIYN